jgi:hypothetical protein
MTGSRAGRASQQRGGGLAADPRGRPDGIERHWATNVSKSLRGNRSAEPPRYDDGRNGADTPEQKVALLWFGVIPTSGLHTWHDLFRLVCGPACLVMVIQMLISFNVYSGRVRHQSPAA